MPQLWRDDRPDFFVPGIQYIVSLPLQAISGGENHPLWPMSWAHKSIESLREDVRALLALPDEAVVNFQADPRTTTLQHMELVTKCEVFKHETLPGSKYRPEQA
jgi:hypothetical protein